ncbi:MAG: CoA-binding protein [Brumimicrobium sp.]|nr:CoA-binding protein [Brumimicrobium sp.]MCO5268042.1 CoA-binding protein [Brumimicrobium sp.]
MEKKKTLVIGASVKEERYSNKAVRMLQENRMPVVAYGNKMGKINGVEIKTNFPTDPDFDTVTLYLSASNQEPYYEQIIKLHPKRVIFNPGTENAEFQKMLKDNGIETEIACTLVLLTTKSY